MNVGFDGMEPYTLKSDHIGIEIKHPLKQITQYY